MAATEKPLPLGTGQRLQQYNQYAQDTYFSSDCQGANNIQEAAIQLLSLGYSVIPTNADKTPALSSWKRHQKQAMPVETAKKVFYNGCSLAMVGGAVSGNLECLDFDKPELFQPFIDMLKGINQEFAGRLVKVRTPSGGYHLIYRCQQPCAGNQKLTMSDNGKETWIETRGEGGYFLTTPSPEHCKATTPHRDPQ